MEFFENFKILQSIIILAVAFLLRFLITNSLRKIQIKFGFQRARILVTNKVVSFLIFATAIIVVAFLWGVDEKQLVLFISSFLTILGIAFFAQWSMLSNITAGLILFINYPVKIGDSITILEKDNDLTGQIKDIGVFFITLTTKDGQNVSIPNSLILQKMIKYK
ncbi:mechanosensitive ion channel domain-containing protein [Polaribacter marinivivus]|jgi:small-conductance mechanosensitive channel|uniref:Mechanosensitive ion channel domain-containing protein n=1 Tax=Polaribacter marinivivus TaxID=1524260 RepID=A0ABV8R890_9FLAO|nr:mechanosensitive ion channel domain-containing protein [uncultured Polaribacter sp.]